MRDLVYNDFSTQAYVVRRYGFKMERDVVISPLMKVFRGIRLVKVEKRIVDRYFLCLQNFGYIDRLIFHESHHLRWKYSVLYLS